MVNGFFADADDGLEAASYGGSPRGRFLRFVEDEKDLRHVVVLHGGCTHGAGVPCCFELPALFPSFAHHRFVLVEQYAVGFVCGRGLKGVGEAVVPDLEFVAETGPLLEEDRL